MQATERWADEYDSTQYRGAHYPCPAGWVLLEPDADCVAWQRYPGIGEGLGTDSEVIDVFGADEDAYNEAREETAMVLSDPLEIDMRAGMETVEHELTIGGETVFRRVDAHYEDVLAAVAEALSRYSNGRDLDGVTPSSGRLPDDVQEQQAVEQRKDENQSLGDFV